MSYLSFDRSLRQLFIRPGEHLSGCVNASGRLGHKASLLIAKAKIWNQKRFPKHDVRTLTKFYHSICMFWASFHSVTLPFPLSLIKDTLVCTRTLAYPIWNGESVSIQPWSYSGNATLRPNLLEAGRPFPMTFSFGLVSPGATTLGITNTLLTWYLPLPATFLDMHPSCSFL